MKVKQVVLIILVLGIVFLASELIYSRWYSKHVLSANVKLLRDSIESELDETISRKLWKTLSEARDELGVPSLQVSVILKGKGSWTGSVGWADPEQKRVATIYDLYHVGSVSKIYTSAVIMKLVQNGKLSLEEPISKYIENIPNGDNITIRNLMNHTSGIKNYTENLGFQMNTVLLRKTWSEEAITNLSNNQQTIFEAGRQHSYSNTNFILLGEIAQQVSGKPFATILREEFLTPLKLENTYYAPQEKLPDLIARGYDMTLFGSGVLGIKKDVEGLRVPFETSALTAGGIVANSSDVSKFTYNLFTSNVLNDKTKSLMNTFIFAPDEDVPEQTGYGLGLRRLEIGGEELVGHTGVFPGFSNVSMYSPKNEYVITVLSNISSINVNYVIRKIQKDLAS